ncbi:MAG: hypothetical protein E7256_00185 [Lachnospiraceae bacterium]|nr:hypothetical protein [Lachnospiraceae bacterium]
MLNKKKSPGKKSSNKSGFFKKTTKPAAAATPKKEAAKNTITNWFYMNDQDISAKKLYEYLLTVNGITPEVWSELDILEVEFADKSTADFEGIEPNFQEEFSDGFLAEHNIVCVYTVTVATSNLNQVQELMSSIAKECGGFFCSDTPDFQPIIR